MIVGDMEGDLIGLWVKILLIDVFYWIDNDIVVQTCLMYGGVLCVVITQGGGASFVFDCGVKVTYFNYFLNDSMVIVIRVVL